MRVRINTLADLEVGKAGRLALEHRRQMTAKAVRLRLYQSGTRTYWAARKEAARTLGFETYSL